MVQVPILLNILTDWEIVDSSDNFTRFGAMLSIILIAAIAIFVVVRLIRFGDKVSEDDDDNDNENSSKTAPESNYTQKTLNVKSRPINMENKYEDQNGNGSSDGNLTGPVYQPSYTGIPTDILTSAPAETAE